jgi:PAT family beta-lactamase induction signal transducer AmpG
LTEPAAAEPKAAERVPATVAWVSSTYFAEGLPYSVVHQVATQMFTAMNASLESIGLVSLYGLAWNLKFVWSPLVDLIGTTRRWLVALEVLLALAIGWIAWPAQQGNLQMVAKILVIVAVLAATHDIAIDGFYLRALEQRQQAAYAGLRVAAYRTALLVGNGALVWVAGKVSWRLCFLLAGALMALLALLHQLVLPGGRARVEDAEPKPSTQRQATLPRVIDAFVSFFKQPGMVLAVAFILVYRLGDAMMFSMSTPLLRDLGMSTSMRGVVSGVIGTTIGIGGSIVAGWWISKRGLRATLLPIAAVQAGALPIYAIIAAMRPPLAVVVVGVLVEQLAAGVGTAGFSVYLMRLCTGKYKAAHFAIATALMSLAATLSGSASGYVARETGYTWFFSIAAMAALPSLILAWFVARLLPERP